MAVEFKALPLLTLALTLALTVFAACASGGQNGNSDFYQSEEYVELTGNIGESGAIEKVRFRTEDSEDLWGSIFGEGEIAIVLTHMRGRDQSSWFPFARLASDSGYKVLTFDFRGYGKSTGKRDTRMDRDLEAAVAYVRAKGARQVILIGASMGGTTAIELAPEVNAQGVAALSPPSSFGKINALNAVSSMLIPLLLIVAENDPPFTGDARNIETAAAATQFLELPGQQHGTNLFAEHSDQISGILLSFIDRWTDDSLVASEETQSQSVED
ncbi:MAG: alpha/beta hydrolase [Acidimicrobiales bacterium]|nr:alpha/beta hydrolase [Acidimicrobiales bacterium]MDP6298530.1 alpha/beta hydrolase [Acidimicrobiales bacterium]HJM27600.1 alpha/beta hydrolase [Acidimicrobiales bacterium]HJM97843.1 alpha/beta hydrolase [Acidimicrobiales bacterium]